MKLCEHLLPLYQSEIHRNHVILIEINYSTGWRMCVFFQNALESSPANNSNLTVRQSTEPHFPSTKEIECHHCRMSLTFPLRKGQKDNYWPTPLDRLDPRFICTADGVYVDDSIVDGQQMSGIPVVHVK